MGSRFLESLDARIAEGFGPLRNSLAAPALAHVLSREASEGGFRGRQGGADVYYTDFALRILVLLQSEAGPLRRAARYLAGLEGEPRDIVSAFSRRNAARLLRKRGIEVPPDRGLPDDPEPGAYRTFLAALCCEILDRPLPHAEAAVRDVARLRRPDGGFSDRPSGGSGQTNPTAAAIAFLSIAGALSPADAAASAHFLARLQAPDGGLRAHAAAPAGDLLSTFTGIVALSGLGALDRLDLAAAARFAASLRGPDGGFAGFDGDPETDIEYTYYGLGTLALLRSHLDRSEKHEEESS